MVIIGTTLTELEIQGVWILTPDESTTKKVADETTEKATKKTMKNWTHLRPPSNRHFLNSLSIPKKSGNSLFTIGKDQVAKDLEEIHKLGDVIRQGDNFVTSSGRVYGFHDDIIYPISGPGIVNVTSQECNILIQFRKNPEKAMKTLSVLEEKGILDSSKVARVRNLMDLMKKSGG
jgi:hypothetical protein